MASRMAILSLLLALALSVRGLESDDLSAQLEAIPDSDFVFTPTPSNKISAGGSSLRRTSREWEALSVREWWPGDGGPTLRLGMQGRLHGRVFYAAKK